MRYKIQYLPETGEWAAKMYVWYFLWVGSFIFKTYDDAEECVAIWKMQDAI